MPKGTFVTDTFEQLAELGKSTVKKGTKQVAKTLNPLTTLDQTGEDKTGQQKTADKLKQEKNKDGNHTPLDMDKLKQNYDNQDEAKMKKLRQHLFQLGRQEEQKLLIEKKQETKAKQQREIQEEEGKKREEEAKKQQHQLGETPLPSGKKRRSIFSPKKVAQREHAEYKPSSGKQ